MESAKRYREIDQLKAVAIVCVVAIHAGRSSLVPHLSAAERTLAVATQFAVPCFLLCSGFLYAAASAGWGTTRARLARILVPYLIAAVLAGLYREQWMGESVHWVRDLLIGNTFGAYYYVFVIFTLILVTPLVARLPAWLRLPVGLFLVATGALRSAMPLFGWTSQDMAWLILGLDPGFPWYLRHPLLSWGYFFAGWELRAVYSWLAPRLAASAWPRYVALAGWVGLTARIGLWASQGNGRLLAVASWPHIWASLALLVVWTFGRATPRAGVEWLSRHTYFFYLYHLFFVLSAQRLWPQPREASWALWGLYLLAGLGGPALLAALLERWLPPAAQRAIGLGRASTAAASRAARDGAVLR